MSLFQRITTSFADSAGEDLGQPQRRAHAVGEMLHERRGQLGLDLETIGEALRIKPVYLAAIEQGRTSDLPGPTYAIGFVRAYAHYLGFDGERVLDSYKAESVEVQTRPDLTLPMPLGARSLPGGPILLTGLILALCGYGASYYLVTGERSRPERVTPVTAELQREISQGATAPSGTDGTRPRPIAGTAGVAGEGAPKFASGVITPQAAPPPGAEIAALPPAPAAGAPPAVAPGSPPSAAPPATPAVAVAPSALAGSAASAVKPAGNTGAVAATAAPADTAVGPQAAAAGSTTGNIEIRAVADCWIQVRAADQSVVFSRVLKAGETYRVPRSGLFLRTGNAGALAVLVDGKQAPSLGGAGTLRRNVALEPDALLAGTAVRG